MRSCEMWTQQDQPSMQLSCGPHNNTSAIVSIVTALELQRFHKIQLFKNNIL